MAAGSEQLFVSRLARLPVLAPSGETIGRIADVVIARRESGAPPPVLGFTVMVQRRPIFLGVGRVRELDESGAVLSTGSVNLRLFEQREGETLVIGELLDAPAPGDGQAAAAQRRGHRPGAGGVGGDRAGRARAGRGLRPWRRAKHLRLPWEQVAGLEPAESAERRVAALANLRPADLAAALQALPVQARQEVVAGLDDDRLAEAMEELPEELQAVLLAGLGDERAADVLEAMDPDDAADLLGELSEADRARLLAMMVPDEAEPVRRLLVYDEETAGGLMTTEPVIMRAADTVAEALARVRDPDLPPALAAQVFVVRPPTQTPTGRYLGVAYLQRLLREAPSEELGSCIDTDLDCIAPEEPTRRVAEYLATYDLLAAPVCDPRAACWGRSRSTTCSTTCCPRPGGGRGAVR